MDKSKIDLSQPAFGAGAQKVSELTEAPVESQSEEVKVVESVAPVAEPVGSEEESTEEQKVPYSRLKRYRDEAVALRQEAAEWRARAESFRPEERESVREDVEVPSYWKELYGDSDASIKAWKINERAQQDLIEKAEARALEAVQNERQYESTRIKENENTIDQNLESLADYVGRDLSDREQSAILDIVDEYTPKDDDGNYLGATIPFEKAWDIYELKNSASKAPRQASRDRVAALNGSPTHGEPSGDQQQKDEKWNPLDWNAWKKRI